MLLAVLGACAGDPGVVWLVAASTGPAAEDAAAAFGAATGQRVSVSAASSSVLARQIGAGAHADVFLSADARWADAVTGLERRDLFSNRLVVVSDPDGPEWSVPPTGCVAVGDPEHVPAGLYAKDALGADWDAVAPHVVPTVDAPAAVRAVQAGACSLAIAYATDATDLTIRAELVADVHYPLVLLTEDGRPLYDWLATDAGAVAFASRGFGRLR
jgi:molybdate transport system substrate-binding protein